MTINEFLVRVLSLSYEQALDFIKDKEVFINGVPAIQRQIIYLSDQVVLRGQVVQSPKIHRYLLYYKPKGVECTLNPEIPDGLLSAFHHAEGLFPVGRLDKESEGLLLLTDDGNLYKQLAGAEQHQEKEYEVETDKEISDDALQCMAGGMEILGKKTRPAHVSRLSEKSFRIILTQGLNRQIRRMCHKLGYKVLLLKRVRIASLHLGNLKPGEYREVKREDILTS